MNREQGFRIAAQGLVVVVVLVAAYAVSLYLKVDELESSVSQAQAEAQKATQDAAAARKKLGDDLNAANARATAAEGRLRQAESLKALLAKVEPQATPALEAAAKAGKPEVRSALLAGAGLVGQIVHGVDHDASLGVLVRALALDKNNCSAALGINLVGAKTVEIPAACDGILPAAKPAGAAPTVAVPAAPAAAPAAAAPAPAAAATPAAKAAEPAAKAAEPAKAAPPAGK